jgi:hypothetical protein
MLTVAISWKWAILVTLLSTVINHGLPCEYGNVFMCSHLFQSVSHMPDYPTLSFNCKAYQLIIWVQPVAELGQQPCVVRLMLCSQIHVLYNFLINFCTLLLCIVKKLCSHMTTQLKCGYATGYSKGTCSSLNQPNLRTTIINDWSMM